MGGGGGSVTAGESYHDAKGGRHILGQNEEGGANEPRPSLPSLVVGRACGVKINDGTLLLLHMISA